MLNVFTLCLDRVLALRFIFPDICLMSEENLAIKLNSLCCLAGPGSDTLVKLKVRGLL